MGKLYATPDGKGVELPDDTTDAEAAAIIRQMSMSSAELKAQADARGRAATTPAAVRAISQGFAANLSDEADAGIAALETAARNAAAKVGVAHPAGYTARNAFGAVMDAEREAYNKANPFLNIAGGLIGAYANPLTKLAGQWVGGAQTLDEASSRAAKVGAVAGGVSGFGAGSDGEARLRGGMVGAELGAGSGLMTPTSATYVSPPIMAAVNRFLEGIGAPKFPVAGSPSEAYQKAITLAVPRIESKGGEKSRKADRR
jgi:hypothetical protein